MELHASFLELNFINQIRALPNPSFNELPSAQARRVHPLSLHLSATLTVNIIVTSLTPPPPSSSPFAKLAPEAEIMVAPKTRPRMLGNNRTDSRSVTSASRKSTGTRSGTGTNRHRNHKDESWTWRPTFLRGLDRGICAEWFDELDEGAIDRGLKVWVDRDVCTARNLRGVEWICASMVHPAALDSPLEPHQLQKRKEQEASEAGKNATKVVARLALWDDAPDSRHAVLSSTLCASLGVKALTGGIVRIEPAPPPVPRDLVKSIKVYPFPRENSRQSQGIKFGGDTKANRESTVEIFRSTYGNDDKNNDDLLEGPLTNGVVVERPSHIDSRVWNGGLLRIKLLNSAESGSSSFQWLLGGKDVNIEVEQEIPNPLDTNKPSTLEADPFPTKLPIMSGIDALIVQLTSHLSHGSSVLLNGGSGSGKTSLTRLLGNRLKQDQLYHTTYFPCRKLLTDETRVSTIKETLNRVFMTASWGTHLGGAALVILDDLDRLCPAETELVVSGENGRSRQVSEIICSIARQYCGADSRVVILATSQGKEALHNVIVGGHVFREAVTLKAPDRDARRKILQSLTNQDSVSRTAASGHSRQISDGEQPSWLDGSLPSSRPGSSGTSENLPFNHDLDFLEIAGQTDGFMPADLVLLLSRAKSEALIRSIRASSGLNKGASIRLCKNDFQEALKGFTPASLRNVTLQSSTTTFASIGGLHATRKILLETLQYPTTYAPIFAQCPLRLRSGLLLFGYPGCGKTLLASAVAGECGLNFISVKGPEILNKYIGASEKSVRDLFDRAEAARPCVLFFDEFDSIAPKRGHDSTGVTDRVVNQLLTQMDGAEGLSGVYVLAATSRPDLIDPALLRPGRLDKSLLCDLPNFDDRLDILQALSKKLRISPSILADSESRHDLSEVARRTEGYSGADLQAVIYNAHLQAIHDILGDHRLPDLANGEKHKNKVKAPQLSTKKDYIQFRFGEQEEREEAAQRAASGVNRSRDMVERATIAVKLDNLKRAKRRERELRRGSNTGAASLTKRQEQNSSVDSGEGDGDSDQDVVVIRWKHIEASLAETRSSISLAERRRLERIYREFVVGRNGEMPDGQGPTEVGGRSSLM